MRASGRLLLAAAMLGAAAAGYFGYRAVESGAAAPLAVVSPPATTTAAATAPATPVQRSIPEHLPDVTLADREGRPRKLSEWAGRPLLINFWATWCAPCRREIPLLKTLRAERRAQGLEVIGIAVDFRDDVLEYAGKIGLDYPLLIGEDDGLEAAAAFGMDLVLPFSIFADRQGRIVTLKVGELHPDEAAVILDTVQQVDAGSVELAAARRSIAERLKELAVARAKHAN